MKKVFMISIWLTVAVSFCIYLSSPARAQWVAIFDYIGEYDYANDLALDQDGNVYVTGSCKTRNGYYDCVTVKYDSSGNLCWVADYNGPMNIHDIGKFITVDEEGNAYIACASDLASTLVNGAITVIKYDTDGNQQWLLTYDSYYQSKVNACIQDSRGYIYLTGASGNGNLIFTIKCNSSGDREWTRLASFGVSQEAGNDITVDNFGNVYVTGRSLVNWVTIKYDSQGREQWSSQYTQSYATRGEGIAVDREGCVYVTGYGNVSTDHKDDIITIKYNASGEELWAGFYNGSASEFDKPTDIAIDNRGYIHISGHQNTINYNPYGPGDFVVLKYHPDGHLLWSAEYVHPWYNGYDGVNALTLDEYGFVYVVGESQVYTTNFDIALVKYSAGGQQLWDERWSGSSSDWDSGKAISLDNNGNIFITGSVYTTNTFADYITIKYPQSMWPTPVVLVSFEAAVINNGVELTWQTASELDCYGWRVERRQGEGQYQDVSPLIPGYGTTVEPHDYCFVDQTAQQGETYEYRLKQIDIGGSITFSDPITVSIHTSSITDYRIFQNSPNPFNASTVISFELPMAGQVKLEVFDISGRSQGSPLQDGWLEAGYHEVTFDGSGLVSGIYIYRLKAVEFVGTGKMVLLK